MRRLQSRQRAGRSNRRHTGRRGQGAAGLLEHRRLALESELAAAVAPAPPCRVYRRKTAALACLLGREDGAEAREMVRSLVEAILLIPEDGRLRVEIRASWPGSLDGAVWERLGYRLAAKS